MAVAAAAIGGAALLGGSLISSNAGSGSGGGGAAARLQALIANELFNSSKPLRTSLISGTPAVLPTIAGLDTAQRTRLEDLNEILASGMFQDSYDPLTGSRDQTGPLRAITPQERILFEAEQRALQAIGTTTVPAQPAQPSALNDFIDTGSLPTALQYPFAASRDVLEDQFGVARENTISRAGARGGQLRSALIGLESDRARAVGELPLAELPIRENLFSQALQIASGSPVQAAQVAGASGGLFESIANRSSREQLALGSGLGDIASLAVWQALRRQNTGTGNSGSSNVLFNGADFGGDLL